MSLQASEVADVAFWTKEEIVKRIEQPDCKITPDSIAAFKHMSAEGYFDVTK